MIDGAGTHNFAYDIRDRLTAATHPNQTNESYTLDDVGNRTASHQGSSYTYQPFNRLVSAYGTTIGYDTNGNLISKTDASGTWTYTWDFENRLKQASKSGGVTVTHSFDALGRRVQRTSIASGTTKFIYDGADVIRDLDGTNATVADYLNGPGIDNELRQTSGSSVSYFLTDHPGTTRALVDTSGSIASRSHLRLFWECEKGSASTSYTYTVRETDSDTGLMYYRARWFDSQQGKFISEDPIGFRGGDINPYGYVWRNPLNNRDPLGLDGWGNDTVDWLDERIEYARQYWQHNDQEWVANGMNNSVADFAHEFADLFRVGSGLGQAMFATDENGYGRAAFVLQDVARAAAIFSILAAPATRVSGGASCECPSGVRNFFADETGSIPNRPRFPNVKDHSRRHGGKSYEHYYNEATQNIENGHRFKVRYEGGNRYNYVTRIGPNRFQFTSTSLNGRIIYTNMKVNSRYLSNKGIALPECF